MKKIILSAILFLGITVSGFAQDKSTRVQKSPEERAQKITDAMDKKLSLTDNQKTQIYQINLERAQAMEKFKGGAKTADRSQIKAQFEASESRIAGILTDSQRATYTQLKAERVAKFKEHKKGQKKGLKSK